MTYSEAILTAIDLALSVGLLFAQATLVGVVLGWAWRAVREAVSA
jgi:hypothetical protein